MRKLLLIFGMVAGTINLAKAQNWVTDFNQAKDLALKQNKKIVMVFQGSDWCAPCIKLDKQIWSTYTFSSYAKEHYVMLKVDFPRKKKNRPDKEQKQKNDLLAEKYNHQGFFPLVVVLNDTGKVLGRTGYKDISPSAYIKLIDSL